jgi:hypothetical protein
MPVARQDWKIGQPVKDALNGGFLRVLRAENGDWRGDLRCGSDASDQRIKLIMAAHELLAACEQLESFIGVMFGRGADAVIPETVTLPIGVPCKLGEIMRETAAAIAKAKGGA